MMASPYYSRALAQITVLIFISCRPVPLLLNPPQFFHSATTLGAQLVADDGYLKNVYSALGLRSGDMKMLTTVADMGKAGNEDYVRMEEGRVKRLIGRARGIVGGGDGLS